MQRDPDDVPRVVKNETFYLIARLSSMFATFIGLPVAGWMLARIIATVDATAATVAKQDVQIQMLSQRVEFFSVVNGAQMKDQELRIRSLEKPSK